MRRWVLPSLFVAFCAGAAAAPAQARTLDFYSTSAQIVPVLLVVLAIETRVFEWRPRYARLKDESRFMWFMASNFVDVFGVLACLLLAELAALHPLATGKPGAGHPAIIYGGLTVGFVAVA